MSLPGGKEKNRVSILYRVLQLSPGNCFPTVLFATEPHLCFSFSPSRIREFVNAVRVSNTKLAIKQMCQLVASNGECLSACSWDELGYPLLLLVLPRSLLHLQATGSRWPHSPISGLAGCQLAGARRVMGPSVSHRPRG